MGDAKIQEKPKAARVKKKIPVAERSAGGTISAKLQDEPSQSWIIKAPAKQRAQTLWRGLTTYVTSRKGSPQIAV